MTHDSLLTELTKLDSADLKIGQSEADKRSFFWLLDRCQNSVAVAVEVAVVIAVAVGVGVAVVVFVAVSAQRLIFCQLTSLMVFMIGSIIIIASLKEQSFA